MLLLLLILAFILIAFWSFLYLRRDPYSNVPLCANALPYFGHALAFRRDMLGFIKNCHEKYGPIFRIKIFNVTMAVICDKTLAKQFFQKKETEMSLFQVLERLYFSEAFSDDPATLVKNVELLKKSIAVNFDSFVPKIAEEAETMIASLPAGPSVKLSTQAIRFVTRTSARCFLNISLDEATFALLSTFTDLLNEIVVTTYLLPKSILGIIYGRRLKSLRQQIATAFLPTIALYRQDLTLKDSLVIRTCIDAGLTDLAVAEVILTLLYVSSENTALGLSATLTDLHSHPSSKARVLADLTKLLTPEGKIADIRKLFALESLDNCVMESARMNVHLFSLNRQPVSSKYLGDHYIGDVDSVILCGQLMHRDQVFVDPEVYRPERFLTEPKTPNHVMTWGAGLHLCPGKNFAVYEIKMATALFLLHFEMKLPAQLPSLNYFSPSAFAERELFVRLSSRTLPTREELPDGYLLRNFLGLQEQKELEEYLASLAKETSSNGERWAIPLLDYNNAYTKKSSSPRPDKLLQLANNLAQETTESVIYDSVYVNGYSLHATMRLHRDEHVEGRGISLSLGASCRFVYGEQELVLHSGDLLIGDFSKHLHGVLEILPGKTLQSFSSSRLSVQIRKINSPSKLLTEQEFLELLQ